MTEPAAKDAYRVLARKYRPKTFDELIGHEAMVRTLANAIDSGRLAHAFVLTGVRGVGKTTTARIISRALNCIGKDGTGGPTVEPCGVCEHCVAIAEDRHVDVLEMDAASHTGVDDIRELIDSVRYRPASARFKIFIIDEVHMLSKNAFNALLKTLEEPPEHVKFIFATTEIRKIPITVLSRCQRFDLRRVQVDELSRHYLRVATDEGADVEEEALTLIARAADGSVRDGLSLLDQAISHGGGKVTVGQVRDMLGLADRTRIFDLMDAVIKGEVPTALNLLEEQYALGADPEVVLRDMLDLSHWLTRVKLVPDAADDPSVPQLERERGREMAVKLGMPHLTRCWQMLLKGLEECRIAPSPLQAAEMILIRLAYAADMPPPGDLIKKLQNGGGSAAGGGAPQGGGGGAPSGDGPRAQMNVVNGGAVAVAQPVQARAPEVIAGPKDLAAVAALLAEQRETKPLAARIRQDVQEVAFDAQKGVIEFVPTDMAPGDLSTQMVRALKEATGRPWIVSVTRSDKFKPTLNEQAALAFQARKADASKHPLVQAVLDNFPGSEIIAVHEPPTVPELEQAEDAPFYDDDLDDMEGVDEI